MVATSKKVRFTIDEYLRMSRAGVFDGGRKVELIEGRIFRMPAQAHPHRWAVSKAIWAFRSRMPAAKYWVVVQGTLELSRFGAPDPDLHVFDVPEGTEEELLPKPFVVVEISDTSYRRDAGIKLRSYAAAGIADYWIVNLNERRVEVYRKPQNKTGRRSGWRYADVKHFKAGQKIALLALPKVSIAAGDLLP